MQKLFSILFAVVLAAASPLNLSDYQNDDDIYAKSSDSINATEMTIIVNDEEQEITEFPYEFKDLKEGTYTIKAGDNTYKLHIDNTAPEISASVQEGTYKEADITFTVKDADEIHASYESPTDENDLKFEDGKASLKLSKKGKYTINISAKDKAGNESTEKYEYVIHNDAPEIKITGIEKSPQNTDYAIKVEVSSNIDIKTVNVTLDGKAVSDYSDIKVSEEGSHTLKVVAEDVAGNTATETKDFVLDKTNPTITIDGVEDGDLKNTDITYEVNGSDAVTVTLNGKDAAASGVISEDGEYTLVATSTDEAGNTATKKITFTIDKSNPEIVINGVQDGDIRKDDVHYSVTSSDNVVVSINGLTADLAGTISNEGTYELVATSADGAGNSTSKKISFTIDKTVPKVTVTGMKNNDIRNDDVTYSVSSTDNVKVTINGKEAELSGTISDEGTYVLVATSTDKAGNVTSETFTFTIDKTAPGINISGINKKVTNETVHYVITADGNISAAITGKESREDGKSNAVNETKTGRDTVSGTISNNGEYTITVNATDAAGNAAEQKIVSFIVDKKDPELSIKGVKKDEFYNTKNISYKVSAKDISALDENNSEVLVPKVTIDGKEAKAEDTVELSEGVHSIKAQVTDAAGNSQEKSVSFEIDVTKPEVSLEKTSCVNDLKKISGDGDDKNLESMTLTAYCEKKPETKDKFSVSGKKGPLSLKKDYDGESDNDIWTFVMSATDKAGNVSTVTRTVARDTVAPKISLEKVERYINKDVNIDASVSDPNPKDAKLIVERNGKESEKPLKTTLSSEGDYVVTVKAVDEAGNKSDKSIKFTIDKTPPKTTLSAPSGHNKSVSSVSAKSNEDGNAYMTVQCDGKTIYEGKSKDNDIAFSKFNRDGEYTVTAYTIDLAGNKSAVEKQDFVIDSTAPVVNLTGVTDGSFANKPVTITAEVNERFFDTNNVTFTYNGTQIPFNGKSANSKVSKVINQDGIYEIKLFAKDKAGNVSQTKTLKFTLDTKKPEITIAVPEQGTYDTVMAPRITIKDEYFKSKDISLSKSIPFRDAFGKTGGTRTYSDIPKLKENDGVYTLTVQATDEAGNVSTETKTFMVNRFGSVFNLKSQPSEYSKEADSDVVITEKNVSGIESYSIKVFRDAESFEAENVKVNTEDGLTTYTIPKSNFDKDGIYKVAITTKDKAGNTSKSKFKEKFVIDNAAPVITYTGVEPNTAYQESTVKMYIQATDTLTEDPDIKVTSGLKKLPVKEDEDGKYVNLKYGYNQNIKITATDKAGNSSTTTVENVSVSTSKLAPILAHKKLAGGILAGLFAAGAGLFAFLKTRKKESPEGDDIVI